MNLFLYPQAASLSNGYGIGVDFAYKKNTPAEDDVVGRELKKFYSNKQLPYLDQYIAKWHKMRASIYLRLPRQGHKCRSEIRKSQHWHRNKKLYLYNILTFIPYILRMKLLKRLT